jgi:soluble lytic murein transglycosylase-like protein
MNGTTLERLFAPMRQPLSVVALSFTVVFASVGPALAESGPDDSFAQRFAAIEAHVAQAVSATPPVDPPRDVLHGAVAKSSPIPGGADAHVYYRGLIEKEAAQDGLAPEIAEAVMAVESGYNPAAVGGAGEIGLMQLLPSTARMLGFGGTLADLADPATNIHYGVTYLAQAWRLAGGDLCTAVMKYRAGHGETRFSFLSVNYCLAVRGKLTARGFPVTGAVPVPTFGGPAGGGGGGCGHKCASVARAGQVNLAALNSQLSALVVQVRAGH